MKTEKILLFGALAALGYWAFKKFGGAEPKKPAAKTPGGFETVGNAITKIPSIFGVGAPVAGTGSAPVGGAKEGGAQGGASIDLIALGKFARDQLKKFADSLRSKPRDVPITQTAVGPGGQIFYNTGNAYIPSGLYSGPGGDIYQDTGDTFVPTELPAYEPTFDYTPSALGDPYGGSDSYNAPDYGYA